LEIFLAEAQDVLDTLHQALAHARKQPDSVETLTTIRRGFHTLKGSGRMVGLDVFGEAAWSLEQVLNHWLAEGKPATDDLLKLVDRSSSEMRQWIEEIARDGFSRRKSAPFEVAAHAVRDGHAFSWPQERASVAAMTAPAPEAVEEPAAPVVVEDVKRVGPVSIGLPLFNIYMTESDENARRLVQEFSEWQHEGDRPVSDLALRLSHTLSGSSATVGLESVHSLGHAIELVLLAGKRSNVHLTREQHAVLQEAARHFAGMLSTAAAGDYPEAPTGLIEQLATLRIQIEEGHAEKIASAPAAEVVSLEDYLLAQKQHEAVEVIEMASPVPELAIDEVPELQSVRSVPAQQPQPEIRAFVEPQIAAAPAATVEPAPAIAAPAVEMPPAERRAGDRAAVVEETIQDEIDSELFEIFSAEAQEGLPLLNRELRAWQENPGNQAHPQALMRVLHTLKGSARMAGALRVGQGAHEMETQIEAAVAASSLPANLFEQLAMRADRLQLLFDVASGHAPESALRKPEDDVETPAEPPVQAAAVAAEPVQVKPVQAVQAPAEGRALVGVGPANVAAARANVPAKPAQAPALVRVRSDILDRLVNQAGEVAIARTKVESEVEGIRGALGELTENVSRLRGQLREIEIQAESQMASRLDFAKEHTEDFDPLEFDRFTRLQELTRLMAESVNDVATVQQNLVKSLGEADRDLGTQARLTRDLTQDLMRVRMVPFDSVADRLYRVVRQASRDSGKRVNLDIRGGQVEMDRGVLERMVAPFEHLLRNSVAHGVESAEQRAQRGKGDVGQLNIDVRQEGNEIRITFNDDGNGLDFARIRQRGVERGLLAADANPADNELTELIFAPGFTTATELTALAGRGVGMDVVRAESASLGGRISVTSQAGKGSQFTIFLPLTLAVTQVVLVKVGEHTVALPASLVAEVQQLKAQALAAAYNDGQVLSRGQRVPMHYLALLLALEDATAMAQRYSPVVVMAQGEERTAVHVDEVIGTREVIVKNIGPQLARVLGIAGATVLGSGEVVLIINPIPLAQRFGRQETSAPGAAMVGGAVAELVESPSKPASEPAQGLQTLPVVMVVDDSLTVRKVTQRLLVREGYQVVLCKDGVDALRQLQDVTPDVMLVDIEMPRMDGFDLTRNVRGDARYANTPIIMITSRTADKHRNMAMELGVNQFLGKPYQDEELLGHIRSYVQHKLMAQSA
jgi:chemosensory pili system protein ChpA (sensor histidine kinase/response regulator)